MTIDPAKGTPKHGQPGSPLLAAPPRRMVLRGLGAALAMGVVLSMVISTSIAGASGSATVDVVTNATFGMVLADAQGFTLYTLPSDHEGISSCTGSSASVWPALTVADGTTPTQGVGVLGTVSAVVQPDGADQVTYDGSPLYTFVGDSSPGQATGNGVGGFKVAQPASTAMGIDSNSSANATVGSPFSFTVTTTGTPTPTIVGKGKLPKGVKFHKGTGTALISGTPDSTKHKSAVGTYHLTITATFGKGKTKQVATQNLTLTVT